jgi:carbon monoxide dehydrogenase subunit G
VKVAGAYRLAMPREIAYARLQDPVILARCMPGCESLEKIGEDEYAMRMKMVMAAVSGKFDGKVRITDTLPPSQFRLHVEGTGKIGFMKGDGLLTLTEAENATDVQYDGEVHVGGTIASVGQRLIDGTAKMLIKRFFDKLATEAVTGGAGASACQPL